MRKHIVMEIDTDKIIPGIGQTVYVVYGTNLYVDKVYAIGRESFILEGVNHELMDRYWEQKYSNYGKTWFFTFEKAKDYLMNEVFAGQYELEKHQKEW